MFSRFRHFRIRTKLMIFIMSATLLSVMSLSSIFLWQSQSTFKEKMSNEFSTMAKIVADRSNAAVVFEDIITLSEILGSLKLNPEIEYACIYNTDFHVMVSYRAVGKQSSCPATVVDNLSEFGHQYYDVSAPIQVNSETNGYLYMRVSTQRLQEEIVSALLSTVGLACIVILAGLMFAIYIQRFISDPLIALQSITSEIADSHDFSKRADKRSNDEIGKLVDAFNNMVDTIQNQNQIIAEHTETLEQKVTERTHELAVANRELEAFSYSVSHDLKAPLRTITGFSRALVEDYGNSLDGQAKDYLERVMASSEKMSKLITALLQLSKVTRKDIEKQPFDISSLVAKSIHALREQYPEHEVSVDIEPGLKAIGDPQLMEIAVENLIRNAWKYSKFETAPHLKIGRKQEHGEDIFYVQDNGCGFDMQYAEKLFKPFARLHSPEEYAGTGVGLATVSRIIQRHHGKIWAEAEPGVGATFFFTLASTGNKAESKQFEPA